jgi:DHA2 family lincomycin resistance protein-like MFS transporter
MMQIKDCMKRNVVSIPAAATISQTAGIFVKCHVGVLPVVDDLGKPIGIIRLGDLLSLELPDFVKLVTDVDFVHNFGAVETTRPEPELLGRPITTLMQSVTTVEEESGLLHAYTLMLQHNVSDIPVVNKIGGLVGIISRVDIGTAILSSWPAERKIP